MQLFEATLQVFDAALDAADKRISGAAGLVRLAGLWWGNRLRGNAGPRLLRRLRENGGKSWLRAREAEEPLSETYAS